MRFRGGEFSTGTKGNFQPELTEPNRTGLSNCSLWRRDLCPVLWTNSWKRVP
jgi:hypothetical protein